MISAAVREASWPAADAGRALAALGAHVRLTARAGVPDRFDGADASDALRSETFERWLPLAAESLGFELDAARPSCARLAAMLARPGPMFARFVGDPDGVLAIVGAAAGRVVVLAPDLRLRRLPRAAVRDALLEERAAPLRPEVHRVLTRAGVPATRRDAAARAVVAERIARVPVMGLWQLRRTSAAPLREHVADLRLGSALTRLGLVYLLRTGLSLAAWFVVGRMALSEQLDAGWMRAWALALATLLPLAVWSGWVASNLAARFNYVLQLQLVAGLLRLPTERTRRLGAGLLLGRWLEAGALETLARTGAVQALLAVVDLLAALAILAFARGALAGAALLLAWCACGAVAARRFYREKTAWTTQRIGLAADLARDMIGHRTKRVQQDPSEWVARADGDGVRYYERGRRLDAAARWTQLLPSGWVLLGLVWLATSFARAAEDSTQLVVGIGVVLLGERAIRSLLVALTHGASAGVAMAQVGDLLAATARVEPSRAPGLAAAYLALAPGAPIAELRDVTFAHGEGARPVLERVSLVLAQGDRVLLQGASGGGKSTLASLLAGLRRPDSGSVLSCGLDRETLGAEGWRHRVMLVPQFHENYLFADTLSFNLFAGNRWPPRAEDLATATALCEELGLGPLLERMPSGLEQQVGEMGWQLSHGERSRVFIARALLHGATAIVLDESLAALDPETRQRVLACVLRRAPTVVLIAHP